jgi:hypothetical protein
MSRKYKPSILFVFSIVATIGITNYSTSLANSIHTYSINRTESRVERQTAPLFNNLGHYHFHVSANSSLAQRYFDQGLILVYGFNHAEAVRSFQEATHLEPTCAMYCWGLAYVLGPNINATMEDEAVPTAYNDIQQTVALSRNATEREQAHIAAILDRNPDHVGALHLYIHVVEKKCLKHL